MKKKESSYFVPTTSKTLDILECFRTHDEELTLEEVVLRTKMARTTAYRILYTLEQRRYVTRKGKRYRTNPVRKKVQVALALNTGQDAFSSALAASVTHAAVASGIELHLFDNAGSTEKTLENATAIVRARMDVAIEHRLHMDSAAVIGNLLAKSRIPWIAVDLPCPGATYCGIDNYKAGLHAGTELAKFARNRRDGKPDLIILVDSVEGETVLRGRMTGVINALEAEWGSTIRDVIKRFPGGNQQGVSFETVRACLQEQSSTGCILVAACYENDFRGAVDALRKSDYAASAAVAGLDGSSDLLEFVAAVPEPWTVLVESQPEKYGPILIDLVLRLMNGEQVSPFCYTDYALVDYARAEELVSDANTQVRMHRYLL